MGLVRNVFKAGRAVTRAAPRTPYYVAGGNVLTAATVRSIVNMARGGKPADRMGRKRKSSAGESELKSVKRRLFQKEVAARRVRHGPGSAKGFISTKKKVRRPRPSNPYQGFTHTHEIGGTGSSADIGFVGHATFPGYWTKYCAWGAVFKKLLEQAGCKFTTLTDTWADLGLVAGDVFELDYQLTPTSTPTNYLYTVVVTQGLANLLYTWNLNTNAFNDAATYPDQIRFTSVRFKPVASYQELRPAYIDLDLALVNCASKSALKIQNRTVVNAADDEVDVNNQPIYGRGYSGKGQGAEWINTDGSSFVSNTLYGIMYGDSGTYTKLKVLPKPQEFKGVSRTGKMTCDPGDIKTSKLNDSFTMNFNKLMSVCDKVGAAAYHKKPFGSFRFWVYEKVIDTGAAVDIILAFESTWDVACQLVTRQRLTPLNESGENKNLSY